MGRKKSKNSKNKITDNNINGNHCVQINQVNEPSEQFIQKAGINGVAKLLENEVLFEKYQPNSVRVRGREYYVHSLCQVCRAEVHGSSGKVVCPKCQLISYCSDSHRREHWSAHAELCEAVTAVCAARGVDHIMCGGAGMSPDDFRAFRVQALTECELKSERPLENWEREMFVFPDVCCKCHKCDETRVVTCERCRHSGFCKEHRPQNHDQWCPHLIRYKSIVKDQQSGIVCPSIPNSKLSSVFPKLLDIEHFFNKIQNYVNEFEFLELTEISTYPLTVLNSIHNINNGQLFNSSKFILHVVGAEPDFETNKIEKWEYYLLHLIPDLKSLEIVFVGPELNNANDSISHQVCSKCLKAKKSVCFKFYNQLYHTFSDQSNFSRPDLICVFNPGLYRTTGFNGQDTWRPTIDSMFTKQCPVLTTAYTRKEILLDVKTVQSTQNVRFKKEPALNPFSSLKPNLNFVSDEESPVIFKNQYYCVMSNL